MTNKPATPLPWRDCPERGAPMQDIAYCRIAANAYPLLVAALRFCVTLNDPTNPLNPHDNAIAILYSLVERS